MGYVEELREIVGHRPLIFVGSVTINVDDMGRLLLHVEVYVGKLKEDDENILYWSDFDNSLYAGEGNIGHMIEQVNYFKDKLFSDENSYV